MGSGGPTKEPGGVGRTPWRSGRGCEALLEVRKGSGGTPCGSGGVGWPFQRSERGREALPKYLAVIPEV